MDELPYLGSMITSSGRIDADVESRIEGFQGLRRIEESSFPRQGSDTPYQEEGLPGVCHVSTVVWCRMLGPTQETQQEDLHLPPQMYTDHSGNLQQATVV